MKYAKPRTLKQLKNHPLVEDVWKEGQDGIFDGYDEVYWLTLKEGWWFAGEQQALLQTIPTTKDLIDSFNYAMNWIEKDPRD